MFEKIKTAVKSALIYWGDYKLDLEYTTMQTGDNSQEKMLSSMVVSAHTIEKGLTMPNKRNPFGEAKAKEILSACCSYIKKGYDIKESRFLDVVGIMQEYRQYLNGGGNCCSQLDGYYSIINNTIPPQPQLFQNYGETREDFFSYSDASFDLFSASRHSCRNLLGHVKDESLLRAIALSMNAPSTCNRQSQRIHLLQSPESKKLILSIQGGSRGFGELADQFILITSDLSCWSSGPSRNGPYLDGGIYLMNLLYCLHHENIGACTLNLYLDRIRTRKLHKGLSIPENEVPVALIAIGIPPEKFDLARSHRRDFTEVLTKH